MEISEIRIKLTDDAEDRLRGFCSITFADGFAVRDLKIIEGDSGLFVAMPSRKLTAHCPRCHCKNHLRARYCNQCGMRLPHVRPPLDSHGRPRLYADIAHPINQSFRELIQNKVIAEFHAEVERAKQPGYRSRYDDDFDFEDRENESALDSNQTRRDAPHDPPLPGPSRTGEKPTPPNRPTSKGER